MTKDQERKVAAKQLLCARYTDQMKDRLRNIVGCAGACESLSAFLFTCGRVLAVV